MNDKTQQAADVQDLQEATAEADPTKVKLSSGQNAGPESLTFPDFTYRHIWGDRVGWWRLTLRDSRIRSRSNVFVLISELDPIVTSQDPVPRPHMGDARLSVYNVVPRDGEVETLVRIEWPSPLLTQISYLVVNP